MKDATGAPIIAQTASINLITGVPGSFKTSRTVDWILGAIAAGEVVFVSNINGLQVPGVIPFEDPREWRQLPPGSVLVVDEAQKFFRARAAGQVPAYITEMETIRHHGIRLVLVTQQPNYLDSHIRGLIGRHEHLVRKDGKDFATVYAKNSCMDEVREEKRVKKLADDTASYKPRQMVHGMHKSAALHTVRYVMANKFRVGWKIVAGAVVAMVVVFYSIISPAMGDSKKTAASGRPNVAASAASASPAPVSVEKSARAPRTAEELVIAMQPRVPGAMWSAPFFDGRPIVSQPRSVCMASVDSCTCMSEQGTIVLEPMNVCNFKAVNGEPYNPYKAPDAPAPPPKAGDFAPVLPGDVRVDLVAPEPAAAPGPPVAARPR